jgi:putative protease
VSEDQMKDARESYAREARQIPIRARLLIDVGAPAHLRVTDGAHAVEVSGGVVAPAQKRPLDEARVRAQLQKTGGTPYRMDEVEIISDQNGFLPLSEINELRRDALSMLTRARCTLDRAAGLLGDHRAARFEPEKTALRVQSGDVDALLIARDCGADDVIYAPRDMRDLSAAHRLGRFYLTIPQQMCAEELENIHAWARARADEIAGVYLTNVAQLDLDWPGERIADFPLNIANDLAALQIAADAYVPSVELIARQIGALGGKKEIVVYGELPLMQLRHCPRRAAEDLPGLHRDCRVCDGGAGLSPLVDRTGARFPLVRIAYDTGCVIEVRNSVPLMLLRRVEKLPAASAWRLLVDVGDARAATTLHRMALNGRDFKQSPLWREMEQKKTTTGHFFRGVE